MTDPVTFTVSVDPATIGTPQQKRYSFRVGRIRTFAHPKVARGMRIVEFLAKNAMRKAAVALPPHGTPVSLRIEFFYAVPKSRRNRTVRGVPPPQENEPATASWTADCDNRAKLVQDALTKAGCWGDDRFVTHLEVRKRWTYGQPRIEVGIAADGPGLTPRADGGGHEEDGEARRLMVEATRSETDKRRRCILAKCPELDTGNPKCAVCTGPVAIRDGDHWSCGRARSCHGCRMNGLGLAVCWACCPGPNSGFQTDGQSVFSADAAAARDELIERYADRMWMAERCGVGGSAGTGGGRTEDPDGGKASALNAVSRALQCPSEEWEHVRRLVATGDSRSMRSAADALGIARSSLVRKGSMARAAIGRLAEIGGADWDVLRARVANANVSGAAGMFGVTKQAVSKREIAMRGRVAWYADFLADLLSADKPFFVCSGVITPSRAKGCAESCDGYELRAHSHAGDAGIVPHPKSGCQD